MGAPDSYVVQIKFGDTDCTGRVYFIAYVRWADDAIIEFLRMRGLTYDTAGGLRLRGRRMKETFVVGEYACRMDRPSHYDDRLLVKVTLAQLRPRTVRFRVMMHDSGTQVQSARVELTYVCILPSTRRSTQIPSRVAARLQSRPTAPTKDM